MKDNENKLKSPFRYVEGMNVQVMNKRSRCNGAHIREMIARGIFDEADIAIMQVFKQFGFLNRHNATRHINNVYKGSKWIKEDYKANFRNLVEHGVLLRYQIKAEDNTFPHCYSLSHGADVFLENSLSGKIMKSLAPPFTRAAVEHPEELMRILSFNQFHISMVEYYGDRIEKFYSSYTVEIETGKIPIDGIYRISSEVPDSHFDFIVISIRQCYGWEDNYLLKLRASMMCSRVVEHPVVIVLCENDIYSSTAEKKRLCTPRLNMLSVFYASDINYAVSAVPPLDGLYRYHRDGNSFDIANLRP